MSVTLNATITIMSGSVTGADSVRAAALARGGPIFTQPTCIDVLEPFDFVVVNLTKAEFLRRVRSRELIEN